MSRICGSLALCSLLSVLSACSNPFSAPSVQQEPHLGPPIAIGEVCVDVTPADAVVIVGGQTMTGRCTTVEQSYTSQTTVEVSADGYIAQWLEVPLIGGQEVVTVVLDPAPTP